MSASMARAIWCRRCGNSTEASWQLPATCPHCRESGQWSTEPLPRSWMLSENDKKFLKSLRIGDT